MNREVMGRREMNNAAFVFLSRSLHASPTPAMKEMQRDASAMVMSQGNRFPEKSLECD